MNKIIIKEQKTKIEIVQVGRVGPKGEDGVDGVGIPGTDGKSAYQIWLELGNLGSEQDFIDSNKGDPGVNGIDGTNGQNGTDGSDGLSAHQVWLNNGNTGTESQFLESLKGIKGDTGNTGSGVVTGGTTGQVLTKKSNTNYDTEWKTLASGSDTFNNYTRRRNITSIGNNQNSQQNLLVQGYNGANTNYIFSTATPISFVNGKGAFYQYSKYAYKDTTATGTASLGYIAGALYADTYNFLAYGDAWFKFGLTTTNDLNSSMFVGLSSSPSTLPINTVNMFTNSYGGGAWAIGFGFEETDTNLQFFFIKSGSYKFKINFNQFTGDFIASDIVAKQAEKAISYRITNKTDLTGLDLFFYNHNTGRGGKYSLLFSQLNQTYMFNKEAVTFSPLWGFWHQVGYTGVKDIFNLFAVDITN